MKVSKLNFSTMKNSYKTVWVVLVKLTKNFTHGRPTYSSIFKYSQNNQSFFLNKFQLSENCTDTKFPFISKQKFLSIYQW